MTTESTKQNINHGQISNLDREFERIRIARAKLAYELADLVLEILEVPQAKVLDHYKSMMRIARKIKG